MAESAVKFLLDKLAPLFENDLQLLTGIKEEVVFLRGELERIRAFLKVADSLQDTDAELKTWVQQVRDIAHDTEDTLDEYAILQSHHDDDHHGHGWYGSIHRLSCCIKNTKSRYRIAYDLQTINTRIRVISETNKRIRQKIDDAKRDLDLLQKRRYLIVLDDVWHLYEWDSVKYALPNNNYGSRIILTTRNADLASLTSLQSDGKIYNMEPLPSLESWDLLCRKAFHGDSCPPHLEEICGHILRKCEGLPLAIVAIGGVLAMKDRRRIDEWEMVGYSLGSEMEGNDKLKGLKKVLSLSFNELPYYLKSCFLYLSIFPEDHLIEHMRIIRLWIAEGFIEPKEGKTLEDVAEEYFNELLNRSMLQMALTRRDGRIKKFRIHDLFREILISKSRDQNFATIVKEKNLSWPDKVRRLSIHNTLENMQQGRLKDDPIVFLQNLPNLVFLKLCKAYEGDRLCFATGGFKKLKHLRFDEFNELRSVDIELGAMPCVETLSIQRCKLLEKVPSGIEHLPKLRVLEFFNMPEKLMKTLCPYAQGTDYWKISHIPEVYSTYWREGGWEVYSLESFCEGRSNPWISSVTQNHELETRWKGYSDLHIS
ncbi:hypothetical protein FEM48_Zijuj11G0133100 [Ziziphus jujuba var. spinosa]|uniref:Disease resistance protein RPM1-like n=1 Tax=Ziziphus jujuba var. spinosa TaxID=714518 RepID=A0A978UJ59_ZIZJJ|nr:hypothetical protein FEM48_Zijuj11G0133100 [Ziziphus jujuba var. spinosa]